MLAPEMNPKPSYLIIPIATAILFLNSCDPKHGETRSQQLEETADTLEAKAEAVREETEQSANVKNQEAEQLRKQNGDSESAKVLEKDAEVTREIGEKKAVQLEEQAEKVREQKKRADDTLPNGDKKPLE